MSFFCLGPAKDHPSGSAHILVKDARSVGTICDVMCLDLLSGKKSFFGGGGSSPSRR